MKIQSLDGVWKLAKMNDPGSGIKAEVPGSVYTALLGAKKMNDPYFREEQYDAERLSEESYVYSRDFTLNEDIASCSKLIMRFEGIDTLADIYLNGSLLGKCDNMHRIWEFNAAPLLTGNTEHIEVRLYSPTEYVRRMNEKTPLWGVSSTMAGFPHLRKAHYMFGWDWGPVLPDMGIWRSVSILGINGGRIESVYARQKISPESAVVGTDIVVSDLTADDPSVKVEIISPDGAVISADADISADAKLTNTGYTAVLNVERPKLWFPRGYGKQPLYQLKVTLFDGDDILDEKVQTLGIRKIEVCHGKDEHGSEFAFSVNGIKIFAMGADYIPEDQLICRRSRERTEKLLRCCIAQNFNMIRVWGGGYYPDDYFYDICDREGLLVWQDCMFACAVYGTDRTFLENVRRELTDNIKRIRGHACLAMWCGNNEIESAWKGWGLPEDEKLRNGYTRMFEVLFPKIFSYCDPETYYHPSSPSAGGGFDGTDDDNRGDSHYWSVWHGYQPITAFREHKFRFCSEYGFESIPCMKTVRSFANESDLDLMSPVMEAHQKCDMGNPKLLFYIAQHTNYPRSFESLIYASQLVQAEAIRMNAENMRRSRGVCMGSLYWQLNDSNPVISWSSVDYFGRRKALHYYAKRFYSQVLVSVDDSKEGTLSFSLANERSTPADGRIRWRLHDNKGETLRDDTIAARALAYSSSVCGELTLDSIFSLNLLSGHVKLPEHRETLRRHVLEYFFVENNAILSRGVYMFTEPKHFEFLDPELSLSVDDLGSAFRITVSAKAFAKGVCLDSDLADCEFSDNWFDICSGSKIVLVTKSELPSGVTAEDFANSLSAVSYYDEMRSDSK